jgi:YVTN family beta-propeller protein
MRSRGSRWVHLGLASAVLASAAGAFTGCGDDEDVVPTSPVTVGVGGGGGDGGSGGEGGGGATVALRKPSKSSTIAISDDDAIVAMVNPGDGSISIFRTADNTRTAKVATGREPSSVVIHPDGVTAFVANRADATVVKVSAIDTGDPVVSAPVAVGSEPTGVALSPTGARLFVAEWAEGRISVIDTATMIVTDVIDSPEHPRAVAVTNDGDLDDDDETLVVPEFFGEPQPGGEASDTGRKGRVRLYSLADLTPEAPIALSPRDSGFGSPSMMTSPNQLFAVAVAGGKIYLPSISASPQAPVAFNQNVQPVLYVGDLATHEEDLSNVGTHNLAALVRDAIPSGEPRFFLADIVDLSFVGETIAYVVSRGANVVQRLELNSATGIKIGSSFNDQIEIGSAPAGSPEGCAVPTGIVTGHDNKTAYVNCWASRRLGVIDLTLQEQVTTVEAANPPANATQIAVNQGLKFFHTGRGRWSNESWSACASCHPDGLSDNITWSFAAGPRQTTSLDGSYSHGPGAQVQRVFNWTGIFDEMHDFERNTRGVSGGLGAVTQSTACGDLSQETPSTIPGPPAGLLGTPVKEIQDTQPDNCTTDWDDVDAWVKTIRPPKALQFLDQASVDNGAALFVAGGCDKCHSGAGFTVSRRFWTPSSSNNAALTTTSFPQNAFPAGFPAIWNEHSLEIAAEPGTGIAPLQVACAIRNIGTFGVPGNVSATDALEVKDNGSRAQGEKGFNVPSLYGLALGAPYLHHGQARTLGELFTDPKWAGHLQAGNAVFVPTPSEIDDLVAYLLTIDADAEELATPSGFDVCRTSFP